MPQIRSERLVIIVAVIALAAVVGLILAVNPVPPTELTISTSGDTTPDYEFALQYQALLEEEGFTLNILPGSGTAMTAERLVSGEADIGIISSGVVTEEQAVELSSLGSLYFEPIWVFYRADQEVRFLSDLRGKRIAIGSVGSGTRLLALRLLEANDVTGDNSDLVEGVFADLADQLSAGEVDAMFFVVSPRAPAVNRLLRDDSIALLNIERADAYRSQYPYLTSVTIGQGSVDLAENIPAESATILAGAANMVVRSEVHPNLIRLLSQVLEEVHGSAGIFEEAGEFPSTSYVELDLHPEAQRYFREGQTFFESSFPFVLASILDRFIIVLIPLVPLLYPLIRGLPPVYNIALRRRIIRWYATLHEINAKIHTLTVEGVDVELARLEDLMGTLLSEPPPPLGFMGDFYNLQLHVELVTYRLEEHRHHLTNAAA